MVDFQLGNDVRVAFKGEGIAVAYARLLLDRMGVATLDYPGGDAGDVPVIVCDGRTQCEGGDIDRTPLIVRMWDFYVGNAGTGVQASAVAGVSWVLGIPGREPLYLPAEIPEKWCGTLGASLALSYYVERLTLQEPYAAARVFNVSSAEILRGFADQNFGNHKQIPTSWRRNGRISPEHGGIYPQAFFRCRDGYVAIVGRSRADWESILRALGDPPWATDELRDPFALAHKPEQVDALLGAELNKHTRDELLALALQSGATFAPVYEKSEIKGKHIVRETLFDAAGTAGLPFDFLSEIRS